MKCHFLVSYDDHFMRVESFLFSRDLHKGREEKLSSIINEEMQLVKREKSAFMLIIQRKKFHFFVLEKFYDSPFN